MIFSAKGLLFRTSSLVWVKSSENSTSLVYARIFLCRVFGDVFFFMLKMIVKRRKFSKLNLQGVLIRECHARFRM